MNISQILNAKCNVDVVLQKILGDLHLNGPSDPYQLEKLSYIKKYYPENFKNIENKLMYLLGLFYKTEEPQSVIESFYKIYQDEIQKETGEILTPVQANAFFKIHNYKYFSFSAPTSIGKSYLFRQIIRQSSHDIIIIVPSRALLTEYIYEIQKIVDNNVLVLQFVDFINKRHTQRHIFVLTPERATEVFKYQNDLKIDFFLLDEAQLSDEGVRGLRFDALVRRIDRTFSNSRIIFAHPFVNNPEAQFKKHHITEHFDAVNYTQQVVGKIYIQHDNLKNFKYFSPYEHIESNVIPDKKILFDSLCQNKTILIYIAKEKIYSGAYTKMYSDLIKQCKPLTNPEALEIIRELQDYIGGSKQKNAMQYSQLIDMMNRGIVIHHGSIPLYGRVLIERFINSGYAKICFSTATLMYGINLPFDIVIIDNFKFMGDREDDKVLQLKNLIGRAGRSSSKKGSFDFGYVFVKQSNIQKFCKRVKYQSNIRDVSLLDVENNPYSEDTYDLIEAIKNNSFDAESQLTKTQLDRIKADTTLDDKIKYILEHILTNKVLTGNEYYELPNSKKEKLKSYISDIYSSHLRRKELNSAEKSILSTAIPIMLWKIQGKSFKHIVSMRYAYVTCQKERREIIKDHKNKLIDTNTMMQKWRNISLKYTQVASIIPDSKLSKHDLFNYGKLSDFHYDILMYDTYDYLDKVISFCLVQPLVAAFNLYYKKTTDERAKIMANLIQYGSNDNTEIYMQRYGFSFEDIEIIKPYILEINDQEIVFDKTLWSLDEKYLTVAKRYKY